MNEFDAIKYSWDKETDAMKIEVIPMRDIYPSPEDRETLREEYEKYLERYASGYDGRDALPKDSLWRVTREAPLSFDEWWRFIADSAKDCMDGK